MSNETNITNKRPFELESETGSETGSELDTNNNSFVKKQKIEDSKTLLYVFENLIYMQKIYSNSELVKKIKNPYFLNNLAKFTSKYHGLPYEYDINPKNRLSRTTLSRINPFVINESDKITIYSPIFLKLTVDYRMAYYEDIKSNDELWIEFTKFTSEIEYKN